MKRTAFIGILVGLSLSVAGAQSFVPGYLKYEYFPASNRQLLEAGATDDPSFAGAVVGSDKSGFTTVFESGVAFADNYGNRFSGFFVPPTTGAYVFFVSSTFDCDLFVSTDDNPSNKRLVAQVPTWTNHRVWNAMPEQRSDTWTNAATGTAPFAAGISLTAGTPYYIEGVHNGGGGPDNFEATFKLLTDPDPADGDASRFQGNVIAVLVPQVTITTFVSGSTLRVSWAPAVGHLESSPVLTANSWSNLGYANPAYVTIGASSNLFLRVVGP